MARSKKHTHCTICGLPHLARGYCKKHYYLWRIDALDINEKNNRDGYVMISLCHKVIVTDGNKHDFGDKYCAQCLQPCYWTWKNSI